MTWTPQNTPKRLDVIITVLCAGSPCRLAKRLHVHPVTMSRWRCGHRVPTKSLWDTLNALELEALKTYDKEKKRCAD